VYVTKDDEHYMGATVFPPVPGLYKNVVPFDFNALYPTSIIANNICWSTLVKEEHIKDSDCHIFEWEDHQGCIHDTTVRKSRPKHIMCTPRYYRFLKEPIGILPKMLTDLLDARKKTKNEMKDNYKKLKQLKDLLKDGEHSNEETEKLKTEIYDSETFNTVLDKRQLAFKVSALVARVTPSSQMVCVMVPAPAVPSMSIVSLVLVALTPVGCDAALVATVTHWPRLMPPE
jgi:DNA polymerase elongation subunit (family B)